jgi:3-mercaptopyruvate sulfurtransferase SseA
VTEGFQLVYYLVGGWGEWVQAGYPVQTKSSRIQ